MEFALCKSGAGFSARRKEYCNAIPHHKYSFPRLPELRGMRVPAFYHFAFFGGFPFDLDLLESLKCIVIWIQAVWTT